MADLDLLCLRVHIFVDFSSNPMVDFESSCFFVIHVLSIEDVFLLELLSNSKMTNLSDVIH